RSNMNNRAYASLGSDREPDHGPSLPQNNVREEGYVKVLNLYQIGPKFIPDDSQNLIKKQLRLDAMEASKNYFVLQVRAFGDKYRSPIRKRAHLNVFNMSKATDN
ncbi:hypothetical protein ACJX0J_031098, partial [Zea mays]